MDHPSEYVRMKLSALGLTSFLGSDRTHQAELRMRTEILELPSGGRFAEIDVLMPARDAKRDSFVQLLLTGVNSIGVHHSYQFVSAVRCFLVEQRGRLQRIKAPPCLEPVRALRKVILGLRNIGKKD